MVSCPMSHRFPGGHVLQNCGRHQPRGRRGGPGPRARENHSLASHVEYDWLSPITSPFLHSLADCSRLIRYDGRGVGLSDRNVPKLSFATFQTDLETVVNSLKLERFALLGTSQGAAIAISYAARHPNVYPSLSCTELMLLDETDVVHAKTWTRRK